MPPAIRLLVGILLARHVACAGETAVRSVPAYSTDSIVNSATGLPGPLAPNTIVSLYGQELAFASRAISADDLRAGSLPTVLPGTGVTLFIGGIAARLYYVSPTQVNFLMPSDTRPGRVTLQLKLESKNGPAVDLRIAESAPGFFQLDSVTPIATLADGTLITRDKPAQPGDVVVLYGTGFGQTAPPAPPGRLAVSADQIQGAQEATLRFGDSLLSRRDIYYVGVTPGFAGLYQVNAKIPDDSPENPQVILGIGGIESPPLRLPVHRRTPAATLFPFMR